MRKIILIVVILFAGCANDVGLTPMSAGRLDEYVSIHWEDFFVLSFGVYENLRIRTEFSEEELAVVQGALNALSTGQPPWVEDTSQMLFCLSSTALTLRIVSTYYETEIVFSRSGAGIFAGVVVNGGDGVWFEIYEEDEDRYDALLGLVFDV
ncbi:MAG: hypothetical protein FWG65_02290 [Turicibacter sp.]|nr:hypothetical protein [Turicibacter sp.]